MLKMSVPTFGTNKIPTEPVTLRVYWPSKTTRTLVASERAMSEQRGTVTDAERTAFQPTVLATARLMSYQKL